jgi:GNAT superfamily N-acetyltransferase
MTNETISETITVRRAMTADVPTILYHRNSMFRDMGMPIAEDRRERVNAAFMEWANRMIADGRYVGFFAVSADERGAEQIIAGAGLLLYDWIPNYIDGGEGRGYIMNVYTEAAFRKRGLAHRLVEQCVEYCRAAGIKIVMLHASDQGRPIYEQIGFKQTNEMRLLLS